MATLKMIRPHGATSLEEAKAKVRKLLTEMKPSFDKYVERTEWNGDGTQARIHGKHVSGTFTVEAVNAVIDLKLSFTASLVKGKIEARIDDAIRQNW